MLKFISSFIPRRDSKDLVYNGNEKLLRECVAKDEAVSWYLETKKYLRKHEMRVNLFGSEIRKDLLVLDLEKVNEFDIETEDAGSTYSRVVRTYVRSGMISDEFFQLLTRVLENVKVIKCTLPNERVFYCFELLKTEETPFAGQVEVRGDDLKLRVDTGIPVFKLDENDFRYMNISLTIKEVIDGYTSFRTHSIVNTDANGNKSEQRYKIGQDLVIEMNGTNILSVNAKETEYDIRKVDGHWLVFEGKSDKTGVKIEDFKQYETETTVNGNTVYRLYGAYTHLLRKVLGFSPQSWQMKFLLGQKRLTTVAGVRRGGKTLLSSYLIMREGYRNPSKRNSSRQVKSLYIAPKEEQYKSVLDYIDTASERIKLLKVFKWAKDEKRLRLVDESLTRGNQVVKTVVSTCDFASGKGYEPARGNGSDFIIIDEAGFIKEDVYLNILPILENEKSKLFAISTIDWNTPKNWFYELLCFYEQGEDEDGYSQRVTIDDIDENLMDIKSKERMKKALSGNMDRYYAELYATFPSINSVFSTQALFCMSRDLAPEEIVIGYDPAKRSDYGGVVVGEIIKGEMFLTEEYRIQGEYSTVQRDFLINLKERHMKRCKKVSVVIDGTMVGDVVAESFGTLIDYKVWYTAGNASGGHPEMDKWGSWKFSKKNLVHMTQSLIDLRMLQAFSSMSILADEIKDFKSYESASGNLKYDALSGHDDVVNAMMLTAFYFGFMLGNYHQVGDENTRGMRQMRKGIEEGTNLLQSSSGQRVLISHNGSITLKKKRNGYRF